MIDGVYGEDDGVRIEARVRAGRMACPGCAHGSDRVHSRYRRTLADAPIGARTVVIQLRVRRFFCDNASCARRTFVEQVPGLTSKHARRTGLLRRMLEAIGLALAGRAGARLVAVLGMSASRDSLLRLVRALPDPSVGDVEVLGVDDFAVRRCQAYGTVLVDILAHRPVDLIEERTSKVLADWLGKHPGVKVVCRDRSGAYAEGARTGAPEAIQVADRWHLWANLGEAVERIVLAHRSCLDEPAPEPPEAPPPGGTANDESPSAEPDDTTAVEYGSASRLEIRTRERHTAVSDLRDKGYSLNAICRELGLTFRTVQRFARATSPEELLVAHRARSHKLDRFTSYVHQRWNAGVTQATVPHRAARAGLDRQPAHGAALPAAVPRPPPRTTPRAASPGQGHPTARHHLDHDQPRASVRRRSEATETNPGPLPAAGGHRRPCVRLCGDDGPAHRQRAATRLAGRGRR